MSIPSSVTSIGDHAFSDCTNLTSVSIASGVTSIEDRAFQGCTSLTSVSIPSSVTSIGAYVFSQTPWLGNQGEFVIVNGILIAYQGSGSNVSIPSNVTSIGEYAFSACHSLTSVSIPSGVTSIGEGAFFNTSLTSVSIPSSVTSIEYFAFNSCSRLTDVYYDGSESQWVAIDIGNSNEHLKNATIHYNSTGPETPIVPDPSGLTLISSVPANGAESVDKHSEFVLTFSGEISKNLNWPKGTIRFVNYETGELALEINGQNFYQQGGRVFGATLILDYVLAHEKLVPGTYSVLIDAGIILASELNSDGTLSSFSGINDKDELVFTIPPAIVEVPSTDFHSFFDKSVELVEWNDGWFQYPASTYIHKLAIASAALSNSAYSIDKINDALDELHFEDVTSQDYEWSTSSNGKAGYTFAHKTISIGSEQFTLVAVVVRGSKNTADWLSNFFDSGMIDGDSGFEDAAEGIIQALKGYCAANQINSSDNIKFLVTGHSRGGIIANIVAAELSTQSILDNVHLDRAFWEDVFGYTFASPRPSTGAVQIACSNIWNIINYPDVVPDVPINHSPRYGIDLFLPHKRYYAQEKEYSQFIKPMQVTYKRLSGADYDESVGFIANFILNNDTLGHYFSVHGIAAYYSWLSSYEADELFDTKKNPMYKELRVACPVDVYVYDEASTLVASIVNDEVVVDNLEAAVIEVESETRTKEKVKIVYLPTDQTYSVKIEATDGGTVSYTVKEMEVTGEESLNKTLGTSDRVLRTVAFNNIEIEEDDVLTGKVDDPFSIPAADYALTKKSGNTIGVILPDSDSSSTVSGFSVTFDPNGGRLATETVAIGKDGKFAQLPVASRTGYTFNGWYTATTGGDRITTDTVFSSDTTVYAQWTYVGTSTPSTPTNPGGWYPGGYNPPAPSYSISAPSVSGGTVSVSPTSAAAGSTVTITTTPDAGYELAALTVSDTSGKTIDLTNKGNGQYSFKMPSGKVSLSAEFRFVGFDVPWSNPFADVSLGDWYYDAIKFVSENGLMNGAGDGFFAPNVKLSRAMLAEILYNKEGRPAVTGGSAFTDVQPGAWYADAVAWAAGKGIITGYGNGQFGPDDDITREQVAVMLYRYAGRPVPPNLALTFSDAYKVSDWAQDAVRWAVDQGVLKGKGNGILDPTGKATRAEAAQMLKNYLEK